MIGTPGAASARHRGEVEGGEAAVAPHRAVGPVDAGEAVRAAAGEDEHVGVTAIDLATRRRTGSRPVRWIDGSLSMNWSIAVRPPASAGTRPESETENTVSGAVWASSQAAAPERACCLQLA